MAPPFVIHPRGNTLAVVKPVANSVVVVVVAGAEPDQVVVTPVQARR